MNKITYKHWIATLEGKTLTITNGGEQREYTIKEKNMGLEQNGEYFYIRTQEGFYYQFKFEEGDFLVGDKFSNDDEFIGEFASFVFGE